jgi:spermidine/putrescine ABC transporter ATP-binding subunit
MAEAILDLVEVSKRFEQTVTADRLSLSIRRGEFFTFLGPSGSGKSTVLRMVAGLETPDSGRILIDGRDVAGVPPWRRNLGMVFQQYAIFPHMSVAENIGFPLRMRGLAKAEIAVKVEAALALVRLQGLGLRRPRQLSGGQQQRVALARALVFTPGLLLMDEPLGALDKKLREEMQFELKRLHGELGITIVYVTHDQEEALTMSDRIALMNRGRIEQLGDATELYERPKSRFVAEFIGESNVLDGETEPGWFVSAAGLRVRAKAEGAGKALLVLRPEKAELHPDDSGDGLSGIVRELVYVGDFTRYRVDVAGAMLTVKVANGRAPFRPGLGDRVRVLWGPGDECIIPVSGVEEGSDKS